MTYKECLMVYGSEDFDCICAVLGKSGLDTKIEPFKARWRDRKYEKVVDSYEYIGLTSHQNIK